MQTTDAVDRKKLNYWMLYSYARDVATSYQAVAAVFGILSVTIHEVTMLLTCTQETISSNLDRNSHKPHGQVSLQFSHFDCQTQEYDVESNHNRFFPYPLSFILTYRPSNVLGHTVAQLADALSYKPEGFDSRWCHWNFSMT